MTRDADDLIARQIQIRERLAAASDDELITQGAGELATLGPIDIVLRPESMFTLAALMQLVQRHPQLTTDHNAGRLAVIVLEHAREYFSDCPAVLEMLRRGDDRRRDVTPDIES